VALKAPVAFVPLVAMVPDQPPEAVQAVALVETQVRVEPAPLATLVGLALSVTLGGVAETVTVADCDAEPPVPVQVRVNFVVAVRAPVLPEPAIASAPAHEALQEVALVDDQVNVDAAPLLTVLGFAERVTDGAGLVTDTVAD
jgi:hypothetical protein